MIIPGILITLATFPGVIVHELGHQLCCRWCRVAILDVRYFALDSEAPPGYVIHEPPRTIWQHLLISVGPFLVNTVLGAAIAFPAAVPYLRLGHTSVFDAVLLWLGVSIAMHAFPSRGDAESMRLALKEPGVPRTAHLVGTPLMVLIYLGAIGSIVWLDLGYGIVVAAGLPWLLLQCLG